MNARTLLLSVICLSGLALAPGLCAQTPAVNFPAASPACTLKQRVGLTDFEIVYSRPGVKGRAVFGGIVPFGQVWRTGANQATKISFNTPVKFDGTEIPAGTYGLFTIPGDTEWTVILNTNSAQWGAYQYNEKADVARFKVTPITLSDTTLETFTIEFNHIRDESAVLNLVWDKTVVPIRLEVNVTSALVPQIEAAMASADKKQAGFYFQAATFYFNHGLDLKKALAWVDAGLADKPRIAFELLHLKAQILAKQGDKEGAIAAAKQSSELAVKAEGPGSSFVKMNDDIISGLH
jgi:hypothetical protein